MVRSTPGSASEIADAPRADWIAVATRKSAEGGQERHRQHQPGQHDQLRPQHRQPRGTTASDERIIPVPYSPLNISTPSAPITTGHTACRTG